MESRNAPCCIPDATIRNFKLERQYQLEVKTQLRLNIMTINDLKANTEINFRL